MRERHAKYYLLGPAIVALTLTTLYPFVYAFLLSFRDWRLSKSPTPGAFVGLENYVRAFDDPNFINSVVVTINYTIISVALSMVIGLFIALVLQKPGKLNTFLKAFLIFPFAMAPALKGFTWRFMLNPHFGILDEIIDTVFPPLRDVVWLGEPGWALFWLAITEVWGWAPYIALVFIGALDSMPGDIFDAAKVDGASTVKTFYYITLPMLMPIIVMVTLLKTIFSVKQFDAVVTLTGGGPGRATETMNYYVYQTGFKFFDMGYASALAYLLVTAMFIFAFLYVRTIIREG
jgi:multiple sugar transport system permease protein